MDVLPGENETIASDYLRHYRSRILHVLDFDYQSARSFVARGWPTYVLADAQGEIVAHAVGLGGGRAAIAKWQAVLEGVSLSAEELAAAPKTSVVCENGICRVVPEWGQAPPVREVDPVAVAAPEGGFWVAYDSDREGDGNVYLRRCADGELGKEIAVTSSLADDHGPAIAVEPNGRVWIAYVSNRSEQYDVYLRAYDGRRWGREIRVTESKDDAMRPSLAVDSEGRVWVTWYEWNRDFRTSRDRDVFARWYLGDEASSTLRVSPAEPTIEDHTDPVVVADPARKGRVWIAWSWDYHPEIQEEALDTDQPSVFAAPVDVEGGVGAPLLVGTPGEAKHAVDLAPSLAFDADGVLWCAYDAAMLLVGRRGAFVARLDGDAFAMPERVVTTGGQFSYPKLTTAPDGSRVLAWTQRVDGVWQVHASRDDGGGWSDPVLVQRADGNQRAPALVCDGETTWVVFAQSEGLGSRLAHAQVVWSKE